MSAPDRLRLRTTSLARRWSLNRRWSPNRRWWLLLAVLLATMAAAGVYAACRTPPQLAVVNLELTLQPVTAAFYQALQRGYFADEGLDVHITGHSTGRQALAAMIEKGSDFATCADTPFVNSYARGAPVAVLATIGHTSRSVHIFGRTDRGITSNLASLTGQRVGVVRGTNTEYVLYSACMLYDLPQSQLTIVDLAPEALSSAFIDGSVDAIVIWEPLASRLRAASGVQIVEVEFNDFYQAMWLVVARTSKRDLEHERALLRALIRASDDLIRDSRRWLPQLAELMRLTPQELNNDLTRTRYHVSLDQSLLLSLEAQRRWLGLNGPEIFDGISPRALSEVDHDAVNLIHPEAIR